MRTSSTRFAALAATLVLLVTAVAACGSSDSTPPAGPEGAIWVPQDHGTIQEAVDAAKPGDLIMVDAGVYNEAVDVTTHDITIRGIDRNKVILDGTFKLENGIRVLDTDGVVVENMTARNYLSNGFYWTGSDRYRGSYLTAYRNGDYGIYSFDAYHGQFDNSYGGGSPDAGFYIGECFPCDAVIDNVVSENNGLGYSGTNSGGDLYIVNSTFRDNRAGIVPNSGSYELCYPNRFTTIAGNIVHDNNNDQADAIDDARLAMGNGILLPGATHNVVEHNLVYNHDRTGIGAVPYPEEDANDTVPPPSQDNTPCSETRDKPTAPADQIPSVVIWHPRDNRVVGNVVSDSGLADIADATLEDENTSLASLNNCFSDNQVSTTAPENLQELFPCDGTPSGGDTSAGALDLVVLIAEMPAKPPKNTYRKMPVPGPQKNMPGATTEAAAKFTGPEKVDLATIEVPAKPGS